ncbi:lipase A, lysosomal acid, cholesterol esterase, putative, partial [Ixodes scapularis]
HSFTNTNLSQCKIRFQSELIATKGYPVEEYEAITSDGYVIGIQRIPRGKNENPDPLLTNKTTILLQHGMLGASSDFVFNFPDQSMGFLLADAGYDVWLGNTRGNIYASNINLARDDRQFWDFSIDEMASEDLPSIIDTILKKTGKEKLQYVGWSQGALQMFALLSEKPEYNKKVT